MDHGKNDYRFAHTCVDDDAIIDINSIRLTLRETPGHTPKHIVVVAVKKSDAQHPFAVFSGGSLLVGTDGRTDLLGEAQTPALTRAQFDTLRSMFLALDDGVHSLGAPNPTRRPNQRAPQEAPSRVSG